MSRSTSLQVPNSNVDASSSDMRTVSSPIHSAIPSTFKAGSSFLRSFAAAQIKPAFEDDAVDEALEKEDIFAVQVKRKYIKHGVLDGIRSLQRQRSADLLVAGNPVTDGGRLAHKLSSESLRSNLNDEEALEQLLQAQQSAAQQTSGSSGPKVPDLIAAITRRSHTSQASTASSLSSKDIGVGHFQAASNDSAASVDSTGSSKTVTEQDLEASNDQDSTVLTVPEAASAVGTIRSIASAASGFAERGSQIVSAPLSSLFFARPRAPGLGLPSSTSSPGEDSPHLKGKIQHGSKTFSITAWYAAHFEALRRSCGIAEATYTGSLTRCAPWNAVGGKVRAPNV